MELAGLYGEGLYEGLLLMIRILNRSTKPVSPPINL